MEVKKQVVTTTTVTFTQEEVGLLAYIGAEFRSRCKMDPQAEAYVFAGKLMNIHQEDRDK